MKIEKLNWQVVVILLGLVFPLAAVAQTTTFQAANMHDFATGEDLAGAGTMTRSADGVWVTLSPSGLDKKAAYTVWWVVFNGPDECLGGAGACGLGDLGLESASIFYATGFTTGTDGTANISAHITAGEVPVGADRLVNPFGPGLESGNGFDAEIHMIVRSHWKIIVGEAAAQIGTVGGGCGATKHACSDQQAIQFNANPLP